MQFKKELKTQDGIGSLNCGILNFVFQLSSHIYIQWIFIVAFFSLGILYEGVCDSVTLVI